MAYHNFGNEFYNYTAVKLDEIAQIFNNQFGDENGTNGSDGGAGGEGGAGGTGGSGGSTSKFGKFMNKAGKVMAIADGIQRSINGTISSLKSMYGELNHILEPWAKADKAASKYAKTLAMTEQGMKNLRKTTIDNVVNGHIGINYNISTDELIEAQQKYVQSVGRSLRIDNTQQETLAAMTAVMGDRSTELAAAFENFGVNLNGVGDHAFKMFTEASKSGLSFEKYSDNVAKNIKIAQNYTFKNGLRGLESMAKKATALKLDMGQVASFADKVSTIEGSIDVASKLQVLGGQFAAIADPMAMLSEGLMDMEGLTDRIVKMVGGLGNFNKATGEVEVSAFNKQRIKAAAQAMGMDYSQLMESVNASTRREAIDREISSSAHARGLNEDMKELLRNTATFDKNGKAGVSVNGEFVNLEDLTNEDYEVLVKETQDEAADIKDIARMLRSIEDIQQGTKKQYEANKAQIIERSGAGDFTKRVIDGIGQANWLLKIIAFGSIAKSLASIGLTAASTIFNGVDTVRSIKNLFGKGGQAGGRGISTANRIGEGGKGVRGLFGRGGTKTITTAGGKTYQVAGGRVFNSSGKELFGAAKESVLKSASKGGTAAKTAATTAKTAKAAKTAATAAKTAKAAATTAEAGKVALNAAKLAKGANVLGIVGLAGNLATDYAVKKGKIKKGGTAHTAAKVGFSAMEGAALGAMVGSAFPGIGTAIGAAVGAVGGAVVGAVKMAKIKREMKVDEKLNKLGIERKGNYGARSYKLINKALETGEISDRMRRKLEKKGDTAILEAIDKKKEEKEKNQTKIAKGMFTVKNAYFNGDAFGGGGGFGALDLLNPLKMTQKTLSLTGSLLKGTTERIGNIRGIPETGRGVTPHQRADSYTHNVANAGGIYTIDITGTITLVSGSNGQEVDITDNLLSDQTFVRSLTDKIIAQTGQNNYGVQRADVNSMGRM